MSHSHPFSSYVAAKEVALQEMESHLGEHLPAKIAGRILLRHAGLDDTQREAMAVKHNSMLTFEQVANALRPLDRPEALVTKVSKTYAVARSEDETEGYEEAEGEDDEEELQRDEEDSGPESDGNGNLTYLMFDTNEEFTEEEAAYIYAYNSAYKDVRCENQARRKGRQFFKPRGGVIKKGKNKGNKGQSKGKGSSNSFHSGQGRGKGSRGTPEELMAKGHMSRECPNRREESASNFFVCQGSSGVQNRTSVTTLNFVNISETKEQKLAV